MPQIPKEADLNSAATTDHTSAIPSQTPREKLCVSFHHGLGDCSYFAHLIPLYTARGYDIEVECTTDKAILFAAAGAHVIQSRALVEHPWGYPPQSAHRGHGHFWQGSKLGHNISQPPFPNIGPKADLWDEYCDIRIDIRPHLSPHDVQTARRFLEPLQSPIVLLHTKGNMGQAKKSLPDEVTLKLYKSLIDRFDGTIVLLDWDNRVPRLASHRIRHLHDLGDCGTGVMLAMMTQADLLIGVDSGPLHAARFTNVPTVGLWMPGHDPTTYTLPRNEQLNVVLEAHTNQWNRFKRIPWNLYEHPGDRFDPDTVADICQKMLDAPCYLNRRQIAADVQLQQFVGQFCRGRGGNSLSKYADRNRSFDVLLKEASRRFASPTIIETGTIRAEEDWGGAGFFTYLAADYVYRRGGHLHTVDTSGDSCRFAREWTEVFGASVSVHQADSVSFLQAFADPIDVLVLDSLDTFEPGHAEHAQRELEAALPNLHEQSIIVFDDTPWNTGAWTGKGTRAVPYLLERGWQIGYAAMVDRMDWNIGRVIERLRKLKQLDNTLFLFLSDNGACHEGGLLGGDFRRDLKGPTGTADSYRTYGQSWSNAGNTPFRKHKHWTHEGGISTPLIIHWPDGLKIEPGSMASHVGHVIDIMPTLIEVAGAKYPSEFNGRDVTPFAGQSFAPLFRTAAFPSNRPLFWEHMGNAAMRQGPWKLVRSRGKSWELYNLKRDRSELHNVATEHADVVGRMKTVWEKWARTVGAL